MSPFPARSRKSSFADGVRYSANLKVFCSYQMSECHMFYIVMGFRSSQETTNSYLMRHLAPLVGGSGRQINQVIAPDKDWRRLGIYPPLWLNWVFLTWVFQFFVLGIYLKANKQ